MRLFAALSLGIPIFFGSHIAQAQDLPQVANATKFSQPKLIPTVFDDTPVDIEAVDVDNDGDMDLVWTSRGDSYGTDAIMWNENLGGGEFGLARPIDVNFNDPRALALGDLNGDGLVDVVAGSNGQDVVATFLNNGISEPLSGIQIKDVAQGRYNTAILTELGDVFVFGSNDYGVGNPPIFNAPVAEIVGHSQQSFSAKLEDGTVQQWGYTNCGVTDEWLNEMTDYRIPENYGIGLRPDSTLSHIGCSYDGIEVVPTDSNFVGIWAGQWDEYWAGGVKADGSVVMWGRNSNGNQNIPENLGPVWKASGGYYWTVALMRDSTLQAWGYNGWGQLNNLPSGSNFVEVKTGSGHGLALKDDGELISWGYDGYGLQQVPAFEGPVVDFGTGFYSSWARTESGQVYLWGDNNYGKTSDALTFIDGLALGFVDGVSVDTSFANAGLVYEGTDVYGLALADFDGDGDLDVLSGGCDDQDVAWYENDGNGAFDGSRHLLAEDIQCVRDVIAVDIDLDGDPDAVTLTSGGQLSWFENIAQGNFGPQTLIDDWSDGWSVKSADLNHDGNPDLVVKRGNGCFRWYANPGPIGDWTIQQDQCPPTSGNTERAFVLVDLIGDDGLDVVTSSFQHGNSSLEISVNRSGYFDETYSAVSLPTGGAGLRGLTAADLDGDGDMDLVATDWEGDRVFWLAQEPSTAPTELRASIDPAATNVLGLAYADFDGDGDMDLVSADHGKDHVELYLNEGGGFVGPTTISYLDAYRVETADLNNDGHMDVLVAGGDSDRVEYIPGNGDGTFGEPVTVSDATNTVWGVSAADLDNDGDLDVVSASRDDDKFAWYKNLGDGNFGPQQILTILIDQPLDVATSDVDGDGDMDIVGITYEGGDRVVWFENQGGGLFSQYIQIADTDGGLYKLHMADVNGDGSEDALVANVERDRVSYYPNLGGGQWGSEVIVTTHADGCQAVFAADMDADGDLDIVSASEADDKVAWYENLGSDEFGMQQPFVIGRTQGYLNPATRCSDYRSVIAFDADGDGLTDVIAGAQQGGIDLFGNLHGSTIGCADESACNYDASAEGTYGCQFDCYGCTIAEAINFSPESTIDDGSCLIPQTGCEEVSGNLTLCAENNVDTIITYCPSEDGIFLNLLIQSGQLEDLADYLTIYDGPDTTAATQMGEPLTGDLTGLEFGATNSEGCLTLHLQTDVSLSCADGFFNPIKYIVSCGYLEYQGCMDESACNYDPDAVIDDGSCTTLDCLGVCGGGAVQDDVCEVCVDVDALLDDDSTPELMEINGFFYEVPASGEEVVDFEKPNGAPNQSQYWDQISPSVALYRGDNQGLFNPVTQGGWSNYIDGTLWGPANSQDLDLYSPNWQDQICNLFGNCQIGQVIQGKTMSLYIPETDEFYLVEFTSWSCCYQGGFAYTRTKVGSPFEVPNNFDNLQGQVNLVTDSVVFELTNDIVQWSMPVGVEYDYIEIEATGAQGGGWIGSECGQENHGRGARITGIYPAGDFPSTLQILVGAMGQSAHDLCRNTGGGGGGSFVVADGQPMVIAGGGGGNGDDCNAGLGADASIYQTANLGDQSGSTGEVGFQGSQCSTQGAGGGFYNNTTFNSAIGQGFLDGGLGGFGNGQAPGGFGGGGAGQCGYGGGGGGYSGGGTACDDDFGGGGGSYNSGLYQENESGMGLGDGRVVIRLHRILGSNCAPGCMDSGACNFDPLAVEEDGSCEYQTCAGCVDLGACNFDETATISDADQCDYYTCLGCTDEEACNYDETATIDAEDCIYPTEDRDCDGNCYVDTDGDGVCDGEEVLGCTYPQASNYNPFATEENGSCVFSDVTDVFGCIYPTACNFNPAATADDGTCFYAEEGYDCSGVCLFDTDGDGICNQFEGCTNTLACNYDPQALDNDGTCVFPPLGYDCDGGCLYDSDGDGICDNFEFPGCTDVEACNYYDGATDDDGSCVYADYGYDCSGYCLGDEDNDGVCDLNEIEGCTIETACNYDPEATENDGSCALPIEFYNCDGSCMNDDDGDGVCDELEVAGCTYMEADNFYADATDDDGSCTFYDLYGLEGCTDAEACNFNLLATDNDGSCIYAEAGYDCDGNCLEDEDGDGICNQDDPDFVGSAYCGPGTEWDSEAQMCVPAPTCIGDLNNDLEVNINDLLDLLSAFGTSCL